MREVISELTKRQIECRETSTHLIEAMDALAVIRFEDVEKKRQMIEELRQMNYAVTGEGQKVLDAIHALRDVCKHTLENGDSAFTETIEEMGYRYAKCEICGKEVRA
jgi:aspartate ammonia-lyase